MLKIIFIFLKIKPMSFNALKLVKPFVRFLPQIQKPGRLVPFQEKAVWTLIALFIYLVCSQIPLFGILNTSAADPIYWMRSMMASNRGTLMDLGISPIITSGMILQLLNGLDLIHVNNNVKEDKLLYDCANKLIAIIFTVGQAIVQVATGFYGNPAQMNIKISLILLSQLVFSGILVILLDELLENGYGLGSGINLFIATNVCENIIWKSFSPKVFKTARGVEFEGCIVALTHLLITRKNKFAAFLEVYNRTNLPNLSALLSTFLMFFVVIYLQGLRVELPTESTQVKGQVGRYPIKLLYASTTPIIILNQIVSHTIFVSRILYSSFSHFFPVRILGVWGNNEYGNFVPISGICYYLFPPNNIKAALFNPFHSLVHIVFMLLSSAFFSLAMVDMYHSSAKNVAKQFKNQRMTLKGISEKNIETQLNKHIPVAAFFGGFCVGLVCLLSGILDTIGSGTNIFLAVSIVWQYIELFTKESIKLSGRAVME